MQYVADNVDHDVRTLDGLDTFHGMGTIAVATPNWDVTSAIKCAEEIAAAGHINIKQFIAYGDGLDGLRYECLPEFAASKESMLDLLWKTSLSLYRSPRPAWAGFMQMVPKGDHPGQASVMFLPMIDISSSDMTCVNSTLHFAGSIGHLMAGTGLQQILEVIFAGNTVCHILSGKAVARAIRGQLIESRFNPKRFPCRLKRRLDYANIGDEKLKVAAQKTPPHKQVVTSVLIGHLLKK